ncbi:MAG: phage tail tape measure protein, partial [Ruminiclostridium sp.]|nr:phage tail tape measure protein [Ruminiclostridium sp.]
MEAGSAALTLVKDGGADFNNILSQMQNSAGATEAAYEKMTSTVDAKLSKLGNSFVVTFSEAGEKALPVIDELIQYVDSNSDEIEDIILDTGEAMKTVIIIAGDLTKAVWENKEAVVTVAAAFASYKTAVAISSVISAFTRATEGATIAQKALNLAMSANPAGLVAAGVGALASGLVIATKEIEKMGEAGQKAIEKSAELIDEVKELNDETERTKENVSSLQDIAAEYENIVNSTMNAADKKAELSSVQEQLNALYEDEARNIDLVNGKYDENLEKLQALSESKRGYMTAMAKEAFDKSTEAVLQASNWQTMSANDNNSQWRFNYENAGENATRDMENILKNTAKNHGISPDDYAYGVTTSAIAETGEILVNFDNIKDINEQIEILEEVLQGMRDKNLTDEFSDNYIKLYELLEQKQNAVQANLEAEEYYNSLLGEITNSTAEETAAVNENTQAIRNQVVAAESAINAKAQQKTAIDELNNSTKSIISEYEKLSSVVSVVNNGEAITYEQLQLLLGIYPELADNISVTTEGYVIEASALDSLNIALMDGVNAQLEAEREKTEAAIEGAETRIRLYQREAAAYAQVNNSDK